MHGTPTISAISFRDSAPIDFDGGAAFAEHDLALAFALDKDRLLDTDRFVLALGPTVGLDRGLIGQFLMQLAKIFSRVISAARCRIGASDI